MTTTPAERPRFRPALWPTLMALPAFLVLVGLGSWQVQRLMWKTDLIAFREAQLAAPAMPLPADLSDPAALDAFDYRRVTSSGAFAHEREIYLAASRRGAVGFRVITPLRRGDGRTVLVRRGWVPAEARDRAVRAEGLVAGVVTVEGVLRTRGRRGWFTPDNDVARNYWFWLDLPAMAAYAGEGVPPLVIEAGPAPNPGGLPIGREYRVGLTNDHLPYAITWYALAVALAVIYVLSQRRPPDG